MEAAALLCADVCCVLDSDLVALGYAVCTLECKGAYGPVSFDHLTADGACLAGGQVTVVTVGQVNTNFLCCLHLELVHSLASLGNVQLIVVRVAHFRTLLFFLRKVTLSEESVFVSVGVFLPDKKTIHLFLFGNLRNYWKHCILSHTRKRGCRNSAAAF